MTDDQTASIHQKIIDDLRARMEELEIKDVELGFRAKIAQSAISRFFHADHLPTIPTMVRLAEALDMDVEIVFTPRGETS